jgi:hypothetical protein
VELLSLTFITNDINKNVSKVYLISTAKKMSESKKLELLTNSFAR